MSILQEIMKWSQGLPEWQQDVIVRLYEKSEITDQDYNDIPDYH